MPEANSAPILSNPVSRYPRITPPEPGQKPKLLDRLREAQAEPEINAYLNHLAVKEKVSASTQNQGLSALLSLKMYPWVGTYLGSKCGLKGEGMSFVCRKEANFPTEPLKRLNPHTQRLPYRRQNPIQLSKSHHSGEMEALNRTKPVD